MFCLFIDGPEQGVQMMLPEDTREWHFATFSSPLPAQTFSNMHHDDSLRTPPLDIKNTVNYDEVTYRIVMISTSFNETSSRNSAKWALFSIFPPHEALSNFFESLNPWYEMVAKVKEMIG